MGGKAADINVVKPPNSAIGNSSTAKSLPIEPRENENSCSAKNASFDIVEENIISCALNPKFCVAKIRGFINGKCASLLVDTGSTVSIVNDSFIDRRNVSKVSNVQITSASGDKINIIGKANVNFEIGNMCKFSYDVYVASNFYYQCIIGLDILYDYSCSIDLGNNCVVFNDEEYIEFENIDEGNICENNYSQFMSFNGIELRIENDSENTFNVSESLSESESVQLSVLLNNYKSVFAFNDNELGSTSLIEHSIDVGETKPIFQRPYRIPYSQRELVENTIKELSDRGIIRPSNSPYSSPLVLVPKKDGSLRLCVDFRRVNEVTKKDVYPLPLIQDMLDALNGSKYYSVLDLCQGYHQVPVKESHKEITAFSFYGGHYEFNFMPFGLCNSAPTFQRLMDTLLSGLLYNSCLVYIDDIIVYSDNFADHLTRLEQVFKRFEESGLKLKAKKCFFAQEEVTFLGHCVNAKGISPDKEKVSAISNFPRPTNVSELRSFVGLISYYRKFIADFATKAAPFHQLLRKNIKFMWTDECERTFDFFKQALITFPILQYPDFKLSFILYTDACDTGLGVVLAQHGPEGERTLAYASRSLKPNEKNYSVIEKEALAIVWAVKYFRQYIYGRKVTVVTDHNPLKWLMNIKDASGRLARWSLLLQDYDLTIEHRAGRKHQNADSLSRLPPIASVKEHNEDILPKLSPNRLVEMQRKDPNLSLIINYLQNSELPDQSSKARETVILASDYEIGNDKLLYHLFVPGSHRRRKNVRKQLAVPRCLIDEILFACHDDVTAGHLGVYKMYNKIQDRFYWKGMYSDVEFWCKSCVDCATKKTPKNRPKAPLNPLPAVSGPFDRVAVDVLGPFPPTYNSNKYILVFSDYLTRWPEVVAVNSADAQTTAKAFVEEIVCRHSAPRVLLSDNGKNFRSKLMQEICKLMNTKKTFTTAYHPETDGLVERFNGTLTTMLSMYVSGHQRDWDTYLPYVMFAYRTSIHESTQETPFFLMHGREPVLPIEAVMCPPTLQYTSSDDYKSEMMTKLQEAFNLVKDNLQSAAQKQKLSYDAKTEQKLYNVTDKVWIFTPSKKPGLSPKLTHNWHGPFEITKKLSDVTFVAKSCDDKNTIQTVHINRLKPFTDPNGRTDRDEAEIQEQLSSDNVVKILDVMRTRNDSKRLEKRYFVELESGETKWVGEKDIKDFKLVSNFVGK